MSSSFEILRLRAEVDAAARIEDSNKPPSRRPSWAPPLVLTGELLDICIKLELLSVGDKPIARLWGQFADPKKVGRTLREANSDHDNAMVGIACRGFELHAGAQRGNRSTVLFEAQRTANGDWRTGPRWVKPNRKLGEIERAQNSVASAQHWVDNYNDPRNPEPNKTGYPYPIYWERSLQSFLDQLEAKQRLLAAAEAAERARYQKVYERYELRHRATELAAGRVAEFAGDQDMQMRAAGRLCGHCSECFRTLTDPKSLEIGIGPECVQHVYWKPPVGKLVRMIDAIADGRIATVDGELRWIGAAS